MFVVRRTWSILITLSLLLSCSPQKPASINMKAQCSYDQVQLMALDEQHFDQNLSNGGSGWRALAHRPGCELIAADLIRDYRKVNNNQSSPLLWHEAQLRANAGDYKHAIPVMEQSRESEKKDYIGWYYYVDATIAFLRRDRVALADARAKLAKVQLKPGSGFPPVKNGFVEIHYDNGLTRKMRWPLNLDVVDGLIRCFDKPYRTAYGSKDCRSASY